VSASQGQRQKLAVAWIAIAVLAYLAFLVVQPFLGPLGWAAVMAIVFQPVHVRLAQRLTPSGAALATTLIIAAVVVVPLAVVTNAFVNEAVDAARSIQDAITRGEFAWIESGIRRLVRRVPIQNGPDLTSVLLDATKRSAVAVGAYSGSVLRNVVGFVFDLVLVLFASFFFLRDGPKIVRILRDVIPLDDAARDRLLTETADLIDISVRSSIFVAGMQGLLGGCAFAAVGINAPVFWGVVMAFFCLLPLGAWLIWLPAAILLAVGGHPGKALVLSALGFGVVSAVDNVVRPMLLSGRTRMNGLMVFISLLGGVAAFGGLGLILGPVVMATAMTVLTLYAETRRSEF
jgi:predicted PurR-regulated permease PerM